MIRVKDKRNNQIYRVLTDDVNFAIKIAYTVLECNKQDIQLLKENEHESFNENS